MRPRPLKLDVEVSFAPFIAGLREMAEGLQALADELARKHPAAADSNTPVPPSALPTSEQ